MLDKRTRLLLLAAMIVAACLALIQIGRAPLWLDEGITFFWANNPLGQLIRGLKRSEPHGPFYYLMMKAWLWLGDSEFWMRSFSALCFTLTVPVVYGIGQAISGRRAGLYAAWLAATAPFLIRYAQEARMYTMLTFFCSLALMATAMLLSRPAGRPAMIGAGLWRRIRGADRSKGRFKRSDDVLWAIYIIGVLGGMLSHNTALLLPVVTTLIFLVAIAAAPQYRWPRLRNLIIASLVILALYIPNFSILSANIQNVSRFFAPLNMPLWEIRDILIAVYSNEYLPLQAAAMIILFILALRGWRRRPDWKWIGFALLGTLILPLTLQAVSLFYRSAFIPRTLIWAAIPFTVVCAVGLARLPRVRLRRIVLAGLLAGSLYGVLREYQRPIYEPWDEAVQALAEIAADDAAVVLCPKWIHLPFNYYWRHLERGQAVFGGDRDLTAGLFQEPIGGRSWLWGRTDEPRALTSLFDDYEELWIVRRLGADSDSCDLEALQDELAGRGWLVERRGFDRDITLFAYSRDGRLLNEYTYNGHEPWDQAAQMTAETAADEAAVVLCPYWTVSSFNYFWRHYDHEADTFGGQDLFGGDDLMAKPFLEPASRGKVASWREMGEPRLLTSLLDDYPELWILNRQNTRNSACDLERLQDELAGRGRLLEEHRLGGIVFYIYSPDGILNDYSSNITDEPWDQAAQMVAETAADEAAVVLCPDWTVDSFNYFWRYYDHKADTFGAQDLFGGDDLMAKPFLEPASRGKIAAWRETGEPRHLTSLLDDYPELWILNRQTTNSACDLERLQDGLAGRGWLLEEHRLDGIVFYIYSPDGILNDYSYDLINEPWDQAAQMVAEKADDEAAVVLCPDWAVDSFNYFWRHYDHEANTFGGQDQFSGEHLMVRPFLEPASRGKIAAWRETGEPRHLTSLLDDYPELWIFNRRGSASCDMEALQDELAGSGWLVERRGFARDITLFAYSRGGRLLNEYMQNAHEPWDQAAQMVAEKADNEAAVVLCPDQTVDSFNYFWRHYDHEADTFGGDDLMARPFLEPAASGKISSWGQMGEPRHLTSLLDDYPELWILNRQNTSNSACDLERLQDALAGRGWLLEEHRLGDIALYVYSPDGILIDYSSNIADAPWDQAAQMAAETADDEAAVLICPDWAVRSFNYFWRHYDHKADTFGGKDRRGGEHLMVRPFLEPAASGKVAAWQETGEPRHITSLLDDYSELWIVNRHASPSASCDLEALQNEIAGRGWMLEEFQVVGRLDLLAYAPADSST